MTFSDVLTLLMTFFVLLISMSSMDARRLRTTFGFFRDALSNLESGRGTKPRTAFSTIHLKQSARDDQRGQDLDVSLLSRRLSMLVEQSAQVLHRLRDKYNVNSGQGNQALDLHVADLLTGSEPVRVTRKREQIEIDIHLGLLFEPGRVAFRAESRQLVGEITDILQGKPVHSVDAPLAEHGATSRLFSPWHLAAWRAAALARRLRKGNDVIAAVSPDRGRHHLRITVKTNEATNVVQQGDPGAEEGAQAGNSATGNSANGNSANGNSANGNSVAE